MGVEDMNNVYGGALTQTEEINEAQDTQQPEEISDDDLARMTQNLRDQQSISKATIGGLLAAIVSAIIWAVITVGTDMQIGWMAIGVGYLVGYVVRVMGKGIDRSFGILGAILSLMGCLLGNILAVSALIASQEGLSIFYVLSVLDFTLISELLVATFHPLDLLFYALAVNRGYRLSIMTMDEMIPKLQTESSL